MTPNKATPHQVHQQTALVIGKPFHVICLGKLTKCTRANIPDFITNLLYTWANDESARVYYPSTYVQNYLEEINASKFIHTKLTTAESYIVLQRIFDELPEPIMDWSHFNDIIGYGRFLSKWSTLQAAPVHHSSYVLFFIADTLKRWNFENIMALVEQASGGTGQNYPVVKNLLYSLNQVLNYHPVDEIARQSIVNAYGRNFFWKKSTITLDETMRRTGILYFVASHYGATFAPV